MMLTPYKAALLVQVTATNTAFANYGRFNGSTELSTLQDAIIHLLHFCEQTALVPDS